MPPVTAVPGLPRNILGVADIRGQVMPVIDLPSVAGCTPDSLDMLIVTEFERSVQGFAVESVEQIERLDAGRVLSAEAHAVGGLVSSIARLGTQAEDRGLALVLDVERILGDVLPSRSGAGETRTAGEALQLPAGSVVLAVDDSFVARAQIEKVLQAVQAPYQMARTGREAWERLREAAQAARAQDCPIRDKVALVLTDLEMPELDGFALTRDIKHDEILREVPVVIHSSLTGQANEQHARSVGADGYVAKFAADELAAAMREALAGAARRA